MIGVSSVHDANIVERVLKWYLYHWLINYWKCIECIFREITVNSLQDTHDIYSNNLHTRGYGVYFVGQKCDLCLAPPPPPEQNGRQFTDGELHFSELKVFYLDENLTDVCS